MPRKKGIDFEVTEGGCFNCTSHKISKSMRYPVFRNGGRKQTISRHIYTEMIGPIPENYVVRHKCDNPKCINPEHLEIGTMKDNMQDMVIRDRSAKGSKSGKSVLTEEKVSTIKKLLIYKVPNIVIAEIFNIGESTVIQIKKNETWNHVPWPRKVKNRKSYIQIDTKEVKKNEGVL